MVSVAGIYLCFLDQEGKKDQVGTGNVEQQQEGGGDAGATSDNQDHQQLDFTEFDFDTEAASSDADPAALLAAQRRPLGDSALSVRVKPVARLQKILKENFALHRLEQDYLRQHQTPQQKEDPESEPHQVAADEGKEEDTAPEAPQESMVTEPSETGVIPRDLPHEVGDLSINGSTDAPPTMTQ